MIDHYRKFLGKICTILTSAVAFPFRGGDGIQHAQFFTGTVKEISEHGILIKHIHTDTVAFYTFPIVGIVEEQVVLKTDPNYEKLETEVKKKNAPRPAIPAPTGNMVSVEEMTRMARAIKHGGK